MSQSLVSLTAGIVYTLCIISSLASDTYVKNALLVRIKYTDGGEKKSFVVFKHLATKWWTLAACLGFLDCEIKIFEDNSHGRADVATLEMLRVWMEKDENAKWCKLIHAMRDVELVKPANQLAKALRNI